MTAMKEIVSNPSKFIETLDGHVIDSNSLPQTISADGYMDYPTEESKKNTTEEKKDK